MERQEDPSYAVAYSGSLLGTFSGVITEIGVHER